MEKKDISGLDGILGEWWLPEKTDDIIQGVLHLTEKGKIELRSIQRFDCSGLDFCGENYPVVNGRLSTGPKVTLINAYRNSSFHTPGYQEDHYAPKAVVIGQHVDTWDFLVKAIEADFDRVSDWFGINPFQISYPKDHTKMAVTCEVQHFPAITVGEKSIALRYNQRMSHEKHSMSIEYHVRAKVEFPDRIRITDAIDELQKLSDFFTLCMGTKCDYDNISFTYDENDQNYLLMNRSENDAAPERKHLPPFLISYSDIGPLLSHCLESWDQRHAEIAPIIDYFVEAHDTSLHHSTVMTFLKLAQALESYSRKTWKESAEPQDAYEAKVERILARFDDLDEERQMLSEMLKRPGANEPSNNQRFNSMLRRTKIYLGISSSKSVGKLGYRVVTTRNYYTHFNEDLKSRIYSNIDLYYVNSLLREMLRILIMQALDIPDETIQNAMNKCGDIHRACQALGLH